jgi:hypothetical protein
VFHRVELIGLVVDSHPQLVNVFGHEAEYGAHERVTERCVSKQFSELGIELGRQPSDASILYGHGPVDIRVSPIVCGVQARKVIVSAVKGIGHGCLHSCHVVC